MAHRLLASLLITALLAALQFTGSVSRLGYGEALSVAAVSDRPWGGGDIVKVRDTQIVPRKPAGPSRTASFENRWRALPLHAGSDPTAGDSAIAEIPATRLRERAAPSHPRHPAPPAPPARAYQAHAPPPDAA